MFVVAPHQQWCCVRYLLTFREYSLTDLTDSDTDRTDSSLHKHSLSHRDHVRTVTHDNTYDPTVVVIV